MAKTNWNSWTSFSELEDTLDNLLNQGRPRNPANPETGYAWAPTTDVVETEAGLIIRAELPGVELEDMTIEAVEGELVLKGIRRPVNEESEFVYHAMERSYGPFARRFALPPSADPDNADAVLADGVLTVTIPRRTDRNRTIEVD